MEDFCLGGEHKAPWDRIMNKVFGEVELMPWHWRPLLGPVWIEGARGRRTGEGEEASSEEPEAAPPGSENQVPGAAVEPASPKPTGEEAGAAGLPGTPAPAARDFEQIQAGLFRFKGTGRAVFLEGQKGTGQTGLQHSTPGALPASITDYRWIAQTRNGIPVYTFK
jgi:hypothetical protein